jgi:hypothetical protein
MYLIRFDLDSGGHEIECCIPTRFGGKDVSTDLLDLDGDGRLVTSNCAQGSVTLYRLTDDRIEHDKDIAIPAEKPPFCHGARFVPPDGSIVCATTTDKTPFAYFLSAATGELVYKFGDGKWKVKDVCFVAPGKMIVLFAKGAPTKHVATPYDSKLSLIALDLDAERHDVLHEHVFAGHTDCCQYLRGSVYVSNLDRDSVLVFRVEDNCVIYDHDIEGFDFPHGLDVLPDPDLLAVTNYGNNSIALRRL